MWTYNEPKTEGEYLVARKRSTQKGCSYSVIKWNGCSWVDFDYNPYDPHEFEVDDVIAWMEIPEL